MFPLIYFFDGKQIKRSLELGYLPKDLMSSVETDFAEFAEKTTSNQVKEWGINAEVQQPYVKTHNVWGARHADRLVTSEGWKRLREWGQAEGYVQRASPTTTHFAKWLQDGRNWI